MNPTALPTADLNDKCFSEMMAFVGELKASGQLLFDSQVLPSTAPTRVSLSDGAVELAEPKEAFILGGFFVVTAASLDEAIGLARRCPHTQVGPVEVRGLNETEQNAYP